MLIIVKKEKIIDKLIQMKTKLIDKLIKILEEFHLNMF